MPSMSVAHHIVHRPLPAFASCALIFVVALSGWSCEQKKETVSTRGASLKGAATDPTDGTPEPEEPAPTPSQAEPVEVTTGLDLTRLYYQSRAPITIAIKPEAAGPGDKFSLFNDSTQATLVENQSVALTGDGPVSYGFSEVKAGNMSLAAYELTLRLFPLDSDFDAKFGYGTNKLRLLVEGSAGSHFVTNSIVRLDFPYFGVGGGGFASNVQRQDGFEAHVGGAFQGDVTNGVTVLTVGKLNVLSR